jgi:hypothetical protein
VNRCRGETETVRLCSDKPLHCYAGFGIASIPRNLDCLIFNLSLVHRKQHFSSSRCLQHLLLSEPSGPSLGCNLILLDQPNINLGIFFLLTLFHHSPVYDRSPPSHTSSTPTHLGDHSTNPHPLRLQIITLHYANHNHPTI